MPQCSDWPPVILKLEREERWFDTLIDRLGFSKDERAGLYGAAWLNFSGQDAYYRPAAVVVGNAHPTNATGRPFAARGYSLDARRGSDAPLAARRLLDFYTPETAGLVADTYARDFHVLDYCRGWRCLVEGDLG